MAGSTRYTIAETLSLQPGTIVCRAIRTSDRRSVVLKVLNPRKHDAKELARLEREYEIGRTLERTVVIEPLALETYEGLPALALEDFGGLSLDQLIGPPMEIGRFLDLAVRITDAVAHIHRQGVVHKDLKPENIHVHAATGEVKLSGFGLASRIPREVPAVQPPLLVEGSLPYLSPEQTGRMNRAVDSRTDLYSLGVTFYRMLTGRFPFEASDPLGWIYCHIARLPPSPAELVPTIPATLAAIVLRLLAKMAEDRYQTARGLRHDLERCAAAWAARGTIEPFVLGARDVADRPDVPQKLYGREREVADLRRSFERVATSGAPELVLVAGYSGIGKSALVRELHPSVVQAHGLFLAGKFDQQARNIPYSTIVHAFTQLVGDLLAEDEPRRQRWRQALERALGADARLIVDVIPPLKLLVGEPPAVLEAPLVDAERRFRRAFLDFLGVFAQEAHPLVLFLDDLQWADVGSLRLLEDILTDPQTRHLLLVGAYRDNEVVAPHPLLSALDRLRTSGARLGQIVLAPLSGEPLVAMIADTVRADPERARPLAMLIGDKTGGNPFFALQFLDVLHHDEVLWLDESSLRWRWDLGRIEARGYTDNVVDFMVQKLSGLPADTQRALEVAACIGNKGALSTLALAYGKSKDETLGDLWGAIREGLILYAQDGYVFAHDRVQQAAHALLPESGRAAMHLEIGRLLLAHTPEAQLEEQLFDVVTQLNLGVSLIDDAEERARLAELNLRAGRKAKAATAFESAARYLAAGQALLGAEPWTHQYALSYALHLERARCEALIDRFDHALALLESLSRHARSRVDQVEAAAVELDLRTVRGEVEESVQIALTACSRWLSIDLARHPTEEMLRDAIARTRRELGDRPIEALTELAPMSDPDLRAALMLLSKALPTAYFTDPKLHDLMASQMVSLSIRHGNSEFSPHGYVTFGAAWGRYFERWDEAHRFGKVAQHLMEREGAAPGRGDASAYFTIATFITPWVRPLREAIPIFRKSLNSALAYGDMPNACFAGLKIVDSCFHVGAPLGEVAAEAERFIDLSRRARYYDLHAINDIHHLVQRLRGVLPGPRRDEAYEIDDAKTGPAAHPVRLFQHHAWRMLAKLIFGHYEEAVAAADDADRFAAASLGQGPMAGHFYFTALALAAYHDRAPAARRAELIERLRALREQHRVWQKHCPETYLNRYALICAELARIEGRDEEAMRLYETAIGSAHDHGFVHHEALACELGARLYRGRGLGTVATAYLQRARACYLQWGAAAKVQQLDEHYPELKPPAAFGPSATLAVSTEHLDLRSVLDASQAISSEIVLDKLASALLEAVLVQSGAQQGALVLHRDGELFVEAQAAAEPDGRVTSTLRSTPIDDSAAVPGSILRYAALTKERVILDDAALTPGKFAADPHLARTRPRSVLCLPILKQARVLGLLYLENHLVAGAFTSDRLVAVELLATQAAISVENALLLAAERTARTTAEAAEQRAAFLAETGARLSESLDFEQQLTRLARTCVRSLADWCVIDLVEGQEIRRVAGAHVDPEKELALRTLRLRYPPRWDTRHPATEVLRTGQPILWSELSDELLRARAEDDEHARLLQGLGARSGLIVPLVARAQRIGTLSLGSTTTGRFGRADLELAQEIASRAAVAIDNARLYRDAQEAIRLREEFISVASHELRTPMTSLKLSLLTLKELRAPIDSSLVASAIDRCARQGDRLAKLIGDLLDATQIERGGVPLERSSMELGELTREVLARFPPSVTPSELRLHCRRPIVGRWDRSRLDQVLTNLVSNALKFGGGAPIDITVDERDGTARVAVTDRGIGVDPEQQTYIFERFTRGVSATHYGGLGLGLYISRKIVEAHGGAIRVESEPGAGATFTIELPLGPAL